MTIAWSASYAIDHPLIDAQHPDFIEKLQGWHKHLPQEGSTLDPVIDTNEVLVRHIRTVDVVLGTFLHRRQA